MNRDDWLTRVGRLVSELDGLGVHYVLELRVCGMPATAWSPPSTNGRATDLATMMRAAAEIGEEGGSLSSTTDEGEEEEPAHVHHWKIATPNGPTSEATCEGCGATRAFANGEGGDRDREHVYEGVKGQHRCGICGLGGASPMHIRGKVFAKS